MTIMETLTERLQEGRSPNTVKTYMSALRTLNGKKVFTSLDFLKNIEVIEGIIKPYSLSYRRTMVVSILTALENVEGFNKEFVHYTTLFNAILEENPVVGMTEKQRENHIEWTEVLERKAQFKKQMKTNEDITPLYFLMSLYTDLPPRRSLDYTNCFIVRDYTSNNKPSEESDENQFRHNYLSLKEQKLIFNDYKTWHVYGRQEMDFSDNIEFKKALKIYLKYRGINLRTIRVGELHPLVVSDKMEFIDTQSKLTKLFYKMFDGRHFSTTMLRHSYITHEFGDQFEKMEYVADAMGHSSSQQRKYNFLL